MKKLNLANARQLSRDEMKKIMGSGGCNPQLTCCPSPNSTGCYNGTCSAGNCTYTCTCSSKNK